MSMCVCGSGLPFDQCCSPILEGHPAPTAEALMRSRYAAYVLGKIDHLARTCTPSEREKFDRAEAQQIVKETKWLGLDICRVEGGGEKDQTGKIDLLFRFSQKDAAYAQRELALFSREEGIWFYAGSEINPKVEPQRVTKIGRNDPCSCGSGKKYKKCCGT
ncbi:MAG TPA: hypothetical protein DD400_03620 [Rhodospirillaceae bacterium]|nr:hypothetical protein [Rhodospirillaceae bacterium]